MEAQESGKVAELVHDWSATELTNSEMQEVRQLYQAFRFMPLIVLISLACLGYIGRDIFGSAFTATVGRRFLFAVRALYIGNFAFLFPLGFTDLVTRVGGTPKEVLGRLRFASSLFSLCFRLWILAAIAFLALRWLAPRL